MSDDRPASTDDRAKRLRALVDDGDPLLRVREVAEALNVSKKYVYARCRDGRLTVERLPSGHRHLLRIRASAALALLSAPSEAETVAS